MVVLRSGLPDEARMGSGPLRKVRFHWDEPFGEHFDLARLSELIGLRRQGMSVDLYYVPDAVRRVIL